MKKVQVIPATLQNYTEKPIHSQKKRRVAGYARVSTDRDEQLTSYEAQVDYYTNYIKGRSDWEFAGCTRMKEFQRQIPCIGKALKV